jgi:hypothetical protein
MAERIEPIRRRIEPVPPVTRRPERDPYEHRRERRRPPRRKPPPEDPGDGRVDVRV